VYSNRTAACKPILAAFVPELRDLCKGARSFVYSYRTSAAVPYQRPSCPLRLLFNFLLRFKSQVVYSIILTHDIRLWGQTNCPQPVQTSAYHVIVHQNNDNTLFNFKLYYITLIAGGVQLLSHAVSILP